MKICTWLEKRISNNLVQQKTQSAKQMKLTSLSQLRMLLLEHAEGKIQTFSANKLTWLLKSAYQEHQKQKMLVLCHIALDLQY